MKNISVVIIDKHPAVRHGVSIVLEQQPNITVIGESEKVQVALPMIGEIQPDVAIIDSSLTESSGDDFIADIKALSANTSIIVYSIHQKHEPVFRAFQAGAKGYILKIDTVEDLVDAVSEVQQGRIFLSKQLPSTIRTELLSGSSGQGRLSCLSKREYEVAKLLSQCINPATIGEILCISPRTVRVHRSNMMQKLQCKKVEELLALLREYFSH